MLARRRDLVAGRKILEQLDVGDQRGAREEPLEEVVAEQRVFRHSPLERALERVDVVDALAGVRAFAEEVLIHVRDGGGVGIDAGRAGEHAPKERALALGRQGRRDPWLENPVALDDAALARLEARPVQRVGERADQSRRGAAGQLGVGVERDHEADRRRHLEVLDHERRVGRAAEQAIELVQLAALALPAHPATLALAPETPAVEQIEAGLTVAGGAVAPVELGDAGARRGQQGLVVGGVLLRAVRPVGQQREAERAVVVGEVVNTQVRDLLGDLRPAGQERRHDHEGLQLGRHAVGQLEPRQRARREHLDDRSVDERGGRIGSREGRERREGDEEERAHPERMREQDGQTKEKCRDDPDRAEITPRRRGHVGADQALAQRDPVAERVLDGRPPLGDQVVAEVLGVPLAAARQGQRLAGHGDLRPP